MCDPTYAIYWGVLEFVLKNEDSHDWEDKTFQPNIKHIVDFQDISIEMDLNFILASNIYSIRICKQCGVESLNQEIPDKSCELIQVESIMNS